VSTDPPPSAASPFTTRADARDEKPQYVLPLVVRGEKADLPARTDALETSARAVLTILDDERSAGDGEWAGAMESWQDNGLQGRPKLKCCFEPHAFHPRPAF
jgi:hypothetical protein